MNNFKNLEEVAEFLVEEGYLSVEGSSESIEELTVEEVVDGLLEVADQPKVLVKQDSHFGLKSDLPPELLKSSIENMDTEVYEDKIDKILEEANSIVLASQRHLSEEDKEEIREDQQSMGEEPDEQ